jgi:hypothetical protein
MAAMPLIRPFELPQSGKYVWMQPSKPDAILPVSGDVGTNLGVFTVAALKHPEKTRGKYGDVRSDLLTFPDILKTWSAVTGMEAEYVPISPESFNRICGPAGVEMSMQYQSGELWGDWERIKPGEVVPPSEIGITNDQLVGLKGDLTKLKDKLL